MGAKLVHFQLLFIMCALKGEDLFLKFWVVACWALFWSWYFKIVMVIHFGASVGVYFRIPKQQNVLYSLWVLAEGLWEPNIVHRVSMQRCLLNLVLNQVGQKVCVAKKLVWSPTSLALLPLPSPHSSCLYLLLTSFETVLLDCVMATILSASNKKTSSPLEIACVALSPLKTREHEQHFRLFWLCHLKKGTGATVR